MDSLGICTVLEGCRQLTKVAFNQLDMAVSVFERMARQTTQLQVWPLVRLAFEFPRLSWHPRLLLRRFAASRMCLGFEVVAQTFDRGKSGFAGVHAMSASSHVGLGIQ